MPLKTFFSPEIPQNKYKYSVNFTAKNYWELFSQMHVAVIIIEFVSTLRASMWTYALCA